MHLEKGALSFDLNLFLFCHFGVTSYIKVQNPILLKNVNIYNFI